MNLFKLIFSVALIVFVIFGWTWNLVKFIQLDFERPVKAEIIHGIGIVTPISIITGYMNIED